MINLKELSLTYPNGVTALQPIDLEFRRGEFCVLLGASGAGKSSLLRCVNHLNTPTTGTLRVDGTGELNSKARLLKHRRRTGIIFQQHQLIKRQTALQNMLIGRTGYYGALRTLLPFPEKDVRFCLECLKRVGLLDKALDRAGNLSGGQQQRVGVARALAQQPSILLADEPVASLDPAASHRVLQLIHQVCRRTSFARL